MCRRWHALPRAGGIDDQDAAELGAMSRTEEVYGLFRLAAGVSNFAIWSLEHPELYERWVDLDELRREFEANGG